MGKTADRLLDLMYEWIEEAKECSSNMRGLARELESLREDCNAWETVGNTTAAISSVAAIIAAPFTGGASVALAAALVGGVGAGITVVTKITEGFKSSSKLERVKEIDERCNEIADEIQDLFDELRDQCPSRSAQDRDKHVVNEFLKAMSQRGGVDADIKDLDDLIKKVMDNALVKTLTKRLAKSLITEVMEVLTVFSLKLEGTLLTAAAKTGGKEIGKAVAIKGVSRFLGGVVGLAFSLPDAIDNWTKAIKDDHETEASKSLRDTAKKIDEAAENLSDKLSQISEMVKKAVNKRRSRPRPAPDPPSDDDESSSEKESSDSSSSSSSDSDSSSDSSDDEERELKMAVLNTRSAKKFIGRNDRSLIEKIQENNLDVLLITESWLRLNYITSDEFRRVLPPNYNFISEPRFGRRGGGVVIVFNELEFIVTRVPFYFDTVFEYVAASLRRNETDEPVLILNIYRPPDAPYQQFLDELRTLLSWAYSSFRLVIIGGDFNIHVNTDSRESRDFQELLDDFGLGQHVPRQWATHRGGNTLDLVISRPDVGVSNLSVRPNSFSDHHTVFFTTNVTLDNSNNNMMNLIRAIGKIAFQAIKRKKKSKRKKRRRKN